VVITIFGIEHFLRIKTPNPAFPQGGRSKNDEYLIMMVKRMKMIPLLSFPLGGTGKGVFKFKKRERGSIHYKNAKRGSLRH
jgi:hypothetical protein